LNELDRWVEAACGELGLTPADVETKTLLDVARDVAHRVLRPGAPITAYLMGVAVGRGADPAAVAARISALALAWPARTEAPEEARSEAAEEARSEAAEGARTEASEETDSEAQPARTDARENLS
jgi:hypothetical protein